MPMVLRMEGCRLRQALMNQQQCPMPHDLLAKQALRYLTHKRPARRSGHSQPAPKLVAGPGSSGPAPLLLHSPASSASPGAAAMSTMRSPSLWSQSHHRQKGRRPLQHVVPRHVLWGGPHRHTGVIDHQAHLQQGRGMQG